MDPTYDSDFRSLLIGICFVGLQSRCGRYGQPFTIELAVDRRRLGLLWEESGDADISTLFVHVPEKKTTHLHPAPGGRESLGLIYDAAWDYGLV